MPCHSTKMQIKTIVSGSKENCSIVISEYTKIIIDIGISYARLKNLLQENSLFINEFDAILITHCHKDHTKGLPTLINKTNIEVLIPEEMYDSLKELVPYARCKFITDKFSLNDLEIELLHTSHDAPFSVGYIIRNNDRSLVYITDTGYINRKLLNKMINHNLYLIESNHDEIMLMEGPYPRFLKERIISDHGHLSNSSTAKYLKKIVGKDTKNIILAHLSETNNTKEKAIEALKDQEINEDIKIYIADQYEEGPFIEV